MPSRLLLQPPIPKSAYTCASTLCQFDCSDIHVSIISANFSYLSSTIATVSISASHSVSILSSHSAFAYACSSTWACVCACNSSCSSACAYASACASDCASDSA